MTKELKAGLGQEASEDEEGLATPTLALTATLTPRYQKDLYLMSAGQAPPDALL